MYICLVSIRLKENKFRSFRSEGKIYLSYIITFVRSFVHLLVKIHSFVSNSVLMMICKRHIYTFRFVPCLLSLILYSFVRIHTYICILYLSYMYLICISK